MIDSRHIGSTLEDFLREENRLEAARAIAIKRVLAWQIEQAMQAQQLTKTEMARRMRTSRSQLDRLLDPNNDKVLLQTVQRAAAAIGKQLNVELIDGPG
ncbi:MAG: XRE family transcriptional regulator [Opitutaceae bacterium]|nr:XRE family transcriptional regulator [Opitutaceae bacterium]